MRWLLLMTLATLLLGFAQKAPCADGDWSHGRAYTHMCFSDVPLLWHSEHLDSGAIPYRDTAVEYPVLTGAALWVSATFTRGAHAIWSEWSALTMFGIVTALLLSACALVVTVSTAQTARGRPYDAAIFALSPLLVLHAFSNLDLLAMAFASGALWAWARRHPVLAGVLIGLGVAAKLYPGVLLVALWILAVRTRRFEATLWASAAAALAWLAVNLPVALAYPSEWRWFYVFSEDRRAERSTLWAIGRTLVDGSLGDRDAVAWVPPGAAVFGLLVIGLAFVALAGLAAPVRPRTGQLAFLCVLVFLLTTKVWSQQFSLWLLPLVALARPRWRLALLWQLSEILVRVLTLLVLFSITSVDGLQRGIPYGWFVLAVVVRDLLLLVLAGLVLREMWCPWLDVVRAEGADDPGGGVFDGAPEPSRRVRAPRVVPQAVRATMNR